MAKKHKNAKLALGSFAHKQKKISPFGKFADRLADAKKKKAQKMTETQKRLIESKRNNKMIKISKKAKKFGLLDDDENLHEGGLTHKGMPINQIQQFNDMQFDSQMMQNNQQFQAAHDNLNFAGFQQQQNQKDQENQNQRPKSKNEVYKQIIQKSKAYKMFRQQVYQENLNVATQLDENFHDFVGNLKFRSNDKKIKDKIEGRDLQYDRLMNQLKQDQRIVSNKVVQKNEKYTQKIRKKKSDQLNKIMKDGQDDENDIRGWIEDVNNDSEVGQQQQQDELDDVQLSSGDQGEDDEDEDEQQQMNENQDDEQDQQDQSQKSQQSNVLSGDSSQEQNQSDSQDDQNEHQQDQSEKPRNNKKAANFNTIKQQKTKQIAKKQSNINNLTSKIAKGNVPAKKPTKRRLNKIQ